MNLFRHSFLVLTATLVAFGTLMVQSSSLTSWPTEFERIYLSRHLLYLCVGVLAAWGISKIPRNAWPRVTILASVCVVGGLVLLLIPGVGTRVNGATRWLRFSGFSVQPSEFSKLLIPLIVGLFSQKALWGGRPESLIGFATAASPILLYSSLIFFQPDLGTAAIVLMLGTTALWLSGWPKRYFGVACIVCLPTLALVARLRPYQWERLTGFVKAWEDFSQAPYQIRQSLMAFGDGGWQGVGLGKGWQKLGFLPEANTDFVFAVVGEELGLIGTAGIVVLWCAHLICGALMVRRLTHDRFAFVVTSVLIIQMSLQAALNVAVATAMVPPKGIAHPLMSYGGSNLICNLVAVGMILNFTRQQDSRRLSSSHIQQKH